MDDDDDDNDNRIIRKHARPLRSGQKDKSEVYHENYRKIEERTEAG